MKYKKKTVKIGFKEKIYLPELLRGLWITNKHFWQNLFNPITHRSFTVKYPEEKRPISPRWRGRHRLTLRKNGMPKCVACMCCATNCPAKCIHITPSEPVDLSIQKYPKEFIIDYMRCVMCGLCVEACPYDAIYMDTGIYSIISDKPNAFLNKYMLLDDEPLPEHNQPNKLPKFDFKVNLVEKEEFDK